MAEYYSHWMQDGYEFVREPTKSGPFGDGYVGLAFVRNGQTYYGWAVFHDTAPRCDSEGRCALQTTLRECAYQTVPGAPIKAGL